jgi:hypothetical protein
MLTHTPSEIYFASEFAKKIVSNIDNKDFMDGRNIIRTRAKVNEDNIKGKLAEIFVYNILGVNNISGVMDFDIYDEGIGDGFDIVTQSGVKIDVKASTDRAKCIMVELKKAQMWSRLGYPDYLCMVAVSESNYTFNSKYIFGVDFKSFMDIARLYKRGDNIPNTRSQLKADNYIITMDQCFTDPKHLIRYCKGWNG